MHSECLRQISITIAQFSKLCEPVRDLKKLIAILVSQIFTENHAAENHSPKEKRKERTVQEIDGFHE